MRLDEGHADIDVWGHGLRDGDAKRLDGVVAVELDPTLFENAGARFDGEKRPPFGSFGELNIGDLADAIGRLVRDEAQRARARTGLLLRAARPSGPVDVEDFAGAVAAVRVASADHVAAPSRVLDLERPCAAAVNGRDGVLLDHAGVLRTRILGERLSGFIPPPPPVNLIKVDAHALEGHGLSLSVEARDLHRVVDVRQKHVAGRVAFRDLDPHIVVVG